MKKEWLYTYWIPKFYSIWPFSFFSLNFSYTQARGGALAFLKGDLFPSELEVFDGRPPPMLLAYINGDHEYVIFDPLCKEVSELSMTKRNDLFILEETSKITLLHHHQCCFYFLFTLLRCET